MKNKLYQALLLIFLVAGISSCDYLDIVPDAVSYTHLTLPTIA